MPPAARVGDLALHCPGGLAPTPQPIISGAANVLIGGLPAARVADPTAPCVTPGCLCPAAALVIKGSMTVFIAGLPAARVGDRTQHVPCGAPAPCTVGILLPPGCPTVLIGD